MQNSVFDEPDARLRELARQRRETLWRALADAQRRLGRLLLERPEGVWTPDGGPLVPQNLQARAMLMAQRIRDLSFELGAVRGHAPLGTASQG